MTKYTQEDKDKLLDDWSKLKAKKASVEDRLETCRKIAERIMRHEGTDSIESPNYRLVQRPGTRSSICKGDVPRDIWEKYSKKSTYTAFYLSDRHIPAKSSTNSDDEK